MVKLDIKKKFEPININNEIENSEEALYLLEPLDYAIAEEEIKIKTTSRAVDKIYKILDQKEDFQLSEEEITLVNTYLTYAQETIGLPKRELKYGLVEIAEESILDLLKDIVGKILNSVKKIIFWIIDLIKSFIKWVASLFKGDKKKKKEKTIKENESKATKIKDELTTKFLALGDDGKKLYNLFQKDIVTEKEFRKTIKSILDKSDLSETDKNKKLDEYVKKLTETIANDKKLDLFLNIVDLTPYQTDKSKGRVSIKLIKDVYDNLSPKTKYTNYLEILSTIDEKLESKKDLLKIESFDKDAIIDFFNTVFALKNFKKPALVNYVKNKTILTNLPNVSDKNNILIFRLGELNYNSKSQKIDFKYSYEELSPKIFPITEETINNMTDFSSLVTKKDFKDVEPVKDGIECKMNEFFNFVTEKLAKDFKLNFEFSDFYKKIEKYGTNIEEKSKNYIKSIEEIENKIKNLDDPTLQHLIKNSFYVFKGVYNILASKLLEFVIAIKRFGTAPLDILEYVSQIKKDSFAAQLAIIKDLINTTKKKKG